MEVFVKKCVEEENNCTNHIRKLIRVGSLSFRTQMEQEKRIRREIANSNERRRMQSINAGFQALRNLLPSNEGEKLSKAAILQQTAEYIYQLEQEKTRLLAQNCQLKRSLNQQQSLMDQNDENSEPTMESHPNEFRRKRSYGSTSLHSSENVRGSNCAVIAAGEEGSSVPSSNDLLKEISELRSNLEQERKMRIEVEDRFRVFETEILPERIREIACQVKAQLSQENNLTVKSEKQSDVISKMDFLPLNMNVPPITLPFPNHPIEHNETASDRQKLPSILEAVITSKSEKPNLSGKQLLNSKSEFQDDALFQHSGRIFVATTSAASRSNLETIVEAIRHLEGDHLFNDDPTIGAHIVAHTEDVKMASLIDDSSAKCNAKIFLQNASLEQSAPLKNITASKVEVQPINLEYRPVRVALQQSSSQQLDFPSMDSLKLCSSQNVNSVVLPNRPGVIVVKANANVLPSIDSSFDM